MSKVPKIIPRGKFILVKPDETEQVTSETGLAIPPNEEQEEKAYGTVVAVGDAIKDIKKGDRVIYGKYAGDEITFRENLKDVTYMLVEDQWVMAFLQDDKK